MSRGDMERWDERYRTGDFSPPKGPSEVVERFHGVAPEGRALDVAAGSGRNSLFLAEKGFEVDAVDISGEALKEGRRRAEKRSLEVNWLQVDLDSYPVPKDRYSLVVVCFYHDLDLLTDLKEALVDGGVLLCSFHLRSSEPTELGPGSDRYRMAANETLRACLDLTVLDYSERSYTSNGRRGAVASLMGRKSHGARQTYPELD